MAAAVIAVPAVIAVVVTLAATVEDDSMPTAVAQD